MKGYQLQKRLGTYVLKVSKAILYAVFLEFFLVSLRNRHFCTTLDVLQKLLFVMK